MIIRHTTSLFVFALATLGLVRTGSGQIVAEKTAEQDVFVLVDAGGRGKGRLSFTRSPKTNEVDSLDFSGPPDVVVDQEQEWTKWSRHSQLEAITLRMITIDKRLLEYISKLDSVKELYCEECDIEADALQTLGKMKGLEEFHFNPLGGELPASGWEFLNDMENLQVLDIPGSRVNADFAKAFPHLRNLREIRFGVDEKAASEIYPRLAALKKVMHIEITVVKER